MKEENTKRVLLHAVGADYPGLRVPGLGGYPYRACLEKGEIVFLPGEETTDLRAWLDDLAAHGIGPDRHVWVPGAVDGNLYRGVAENPALRLLMLGEIDQGKRLDLFSSSVSAERFVRETLGRTWDVTLNPEGRLARDIDNKVLLRRFAERRGLRDLFPEYREVRTRVDLEMAIPNFPGPMAVTWVPDAASGVGLGFYNRGPHPKEIGTRWESRPWPTLLQRFVPHIPASLTFRMTKNTAHFVYASLQWLSDMPVGEMLEVSNFVPDAEHPHRGQHLGNILSTEVSVGPLSEERIRQAVELVYPLVAAIHQTGFNNGHLGIDIGFTEDRVYVFEANPRCTHARYSAGILRAVRGFFPDRRLTVALVNVDNVDSRLTTYEAAKARLREAGLYFSGAEGGALLYHTTLLPRKCGVAVAASTYGQTVEMVKAATKALGGS